MKLWLWTATTYWLGLGVGVGFAAGIPVLGGGCVALALVSFFVIGMNRSDQ